MPISSFDFQHYLSRLSSINEVSIQALRGGITNLTVRVTFCPSIPRRLVQERLSLATSLQPGKETDQPHLWSGEEADEPLLTTVVLKHAMPYLAGRPSQAMDVGRQTKEADALRFLAALHGGEKDCKPNSLSPNKPLVRSPELIFHDTVSNVLWIEDLGDNQLLVDVLLEGRNSAVTSALASELAAFLANLYRSTKPNALSAIVQEEETGERGDAALNTYFSESVRTILTAHGIEERESLIKRVEESLYFRDKEGPCLGMVDFWPGNILVLKGGGCGVIDWEYFGVSSAASELGMFVAHLRVHTLKPGPSAEAQQMIKDFVKSLIAGFQAAVGTPLSQYFKRRLLLCCGRELIHDVSLYKDLDAEGHRRLCLAGVRALRAVGLNEAAMNLQHFDVESDGWVLEALQLV